MKLIDKYNREHNYLRLSVTDKCNLNCSYCNPHNGYQKFSNNSELLSLEEIERIVEIFVTQFEFKKIRLTGGEPFARRNIEKLISSLKLLKSKYNFELSATSNGTLIKGKITELMESGIDRFNFSLDSLQKDKYLKITGTDSFDIAIRTIEEAINIAPMKVKINTVIMKGLNDNELLDFVEFAIRKNVTLRFIEYMPFSNNLYDKNQLLSYIDMIHILSDKYSLDKLDNQNESVSKDYRVEGNNGIISFITSMSEHFCNDCNRLRDTSDGKLKLCLFSHKENDMDLKTLIRNHAPDEVIDREIIGFIGKKKDVHDDIDSLIQLKNSSMISVGG